MFGVRTERAGSAKHPLLYLGLLMSAGTISLAGQNAKPAQAASLLRPPIPQRCLSTAHRSDKIGQVLETVRDHPTAGAFNTLGVLYAQQDQVSCAIPAFEASIRA